jgi:CBS domain containing-hemolysin-like protein
LWKSFGEIEDEHDLDEELIEKELGDDTYIFRLDLMEYLNQTYKLNIPESDSYGTLFIVDFTNDIPKRRSDRDRYLSFYIEEATNKKIELVKLTVKE